MPKTKGTDPASLRKQLDVSLPSEPTVSPVTLDNEQRGNFATAQEAAITETEEEEKGTPGRKKRSPIMKKAKNPYATEEAELPPDMVHLEDRSLHGWLDKRPKKGGYFTSWKRMFVTVEHLKLRYFKDQRQANQKGVIDFTRVKTRLSVVDDNTFKISAAVKGGTEKEFVFRTLREGNLGTWISYI